MVISESKRAVHVQDDIAVDVLEEVTLGLLKVQEMQRIGSRFSIDILSSISSLKSLDLLRTRELSAENGLVVVMGELES